MVRSVADPPRTFAAAAALEPAHRRVQLALLLLQGAQRVAGVPVGGLHLDQLQPGLAGALGVPQLRQRRRRRVCVCVGGGGGAGNE